MHVAARSEIRRMRQLADRFAMCIRDIMLRRWFTAAYDLKLHIVGRSPACFAAISTRLEARRCECGWVLFVESECKAQIVPLLVTLPLSFLTQTTHECCRDKDKRNKYEAHQWQCHRETKAAVNLCFQEALDREHRRDRAADGLRCLSDGFVKDPRPPCFLCVYACEMEGEEREEGGGGEHGS